VVPVRNQYARRHDVPSDERVPSAAQGSSIELSSWPTSRPVSIPQHAEIWTWRVTWRGIRVCAVGALVAVGLLLSGCGSSPLPPIQKDRQVSLQDPQSLVLGPEDMPRAYNNSRAEPPASMDPTDPPSPFPENAPVARTVNAASSTYVGIGPPYLQINAIVIVCPTVSVAQYLISRSSAVAADFFGTAFPTVTRFSIGDSGSQFFSLVHAVPEDSIVWRRGRVVAGVGVDGGVIGALLPALAHREDDLIKRAA
jgi:hypothetical protein